MTSHGAAGSAIQPDLMPLSKTAPRPEQRGHAASPGSGPAGESCGTCQHICRVSTFGHYFKCALNRPNWTNGARTDVRSRDAACGKWAGMEVPNGKA